MTIQAILSTIQQSTPLDAIYCVQGSEKYLQSFVREAFITKLNLEENDLNFAQFDMDRESIDQLIDEAETLPFFGDQRLIFVEDPYFLTAQKRSNSIDHNIERLIEYLNDPVESTVMVFFAPYDKFDERKKITKLIKKQGKVFDVKPPSDNDMKKFISERLKKENIQMAPVVMDRFLHLTEMKLSKAMTELDKLLLYAGQKKQIDMMAIEQLIPKSIENDVFALTEAIMQGNSLEALQLYRELLLQGEETIKINAILIGQIRLYIQVEFLMKQGMQQGAIAEQIKIHPYRIKLAMQRVRKYDRRELSRLYDQLVENDYRMKTGQVSKDYLFELFILETAQHLVG